MLRSSTSKLSASLLSAVFFEPVGLLIGLGLLLLLRLLLRFVFPTFRPSLLSGRALRKKGLGLGLRAAFRDKVGLFKPESTAMCWAPDQENTRD